MWPEKDHPNAHKSLSWPWGGTEPRSIILCTGIHWGTGGTEPCSIILCTGIHWGTGVALNPTLSYCALGFTEALGWH